MIMERSKEWPSIAAMANDETTNHQSSSKVIHGIRIDLNRLISVQEKQSKLISQVLDQLLIVSRGAL